MGWNEEDRNQILENARRRRSPRCPNDDALIRVDRRPVSDGIAYELSCPMCRTEANEIVFRSSERYSPGRMRELAINQRHGKGSLCEYCGMRLSVQWKDSFGSEGTVTVECGYCGIHQSEQLPLPLDSGPRP
jgi:hypothetical protein